MATEFSTTQRATEPHSVVLQQSHRASSVFDTLIEVLEETPEALSAEYSDDLLCELVRLHVPDVTTEEISAALDTLSSRAIALGEFMRNKRRSEREST